MLKFRINCLRNELIGKYQPNHNLTSVYANNLFSCYGLIEMAQMITKIWKSNEYKIFEIFEYIIEPYLYNIEYGGDLRFTFLTIMMYYQILSQILSRGSRGKECVLPYIENLNKFYIQIFDNYHSSYIDKFNRFMKCLGFTYFSVSYSTFGDFPPRFTIICITNILNQYMNEPRFKQQLNDDTRKLLLTYLKN